MGPVKQQLRAVVVSYLMCCFAGCRVDSMDRLKAKCATLEGEIRDPARLKDFYQFAFNYAKNPGQKCLGSYFLHLLRLTNV